MPHDAAKTLKYEYFRNARGQNLRYATHFTENPKGLILILPGRTEFIEKYVETIQACLDRGYAVAAIDWIDHGLSDRSLPDRLKCHSRNFSEYVDDLTIWIEKILPTHFSPQLKRIGLGSSMGGHIAFRSAFERPALFNGLALAAPMFGIQAVHWMGMTGAQIVSGILALFSERTISSNGEDSFKARSTPGNGLFSHDPVRDKLHMDLCRQNPQLRTGDPTFGWVHAAIQSCAKIKQTDLSAMTTPVFLAISGKDMIVDNQASQALGRRIKGCDTITIEGAGHEILMETDVLQKKFWEGFDRLLERTI